MTLPDLAGVTRPRDDPPSDEQPLNRLFRHGADTLSDAELIAVLTGRPLREAHVMLRDGLAAFAGRDWTATPKKRSRRIAGRIAAALEVSKRLAAQLARAGEPISTAEAIANPMMARYGFARHEHLFLVFLDSKYRVIAEREIYVGTINSATVSTREPIRLALDLNAVYLIAVHNHPSGDTTPSGEDLEFTRNLVAAAKLFAMDLLDHIIVGMNCFASMRRRGDIPMREQDYRAGILQMYR